jgi:glucosyl-3-phosphoglycerate synthase
VTPSVETASACVIARDEEHTVTGVVEPLIALRDEGVLHRVVVIDLGSSDHTAAAALAAGAEVLAAAEVQPDLGPVLGKGDAIWRAAQVVGDDVLVLLDGDLRGDLRAGVPLLLAPLAADADVVLVKGHFRRVDADGRPTGGGRVTEITARPLLSLLLPELTVLHEPLSGQVALRRSCLRELPVVTGWGVEIGMLLDVVGRWGLGAVAQADLGVIEHDPPSTEALSAMATDVMATLLDRAAAQGVPLTAAQQASVRAHLPVQRGRLGT